MTHCRGRTCPWALLPSLSFLTALLLHAGAAHGMQALGSVAVPGRVGRVHVSGERIYVTGGAGITAIDAAGPGAPEVLAVLPTSDLRGLEVAGDLLFMAEGVSGLRVVDFSDPAAPRVLATRSDLVDAAQIQVEGDRLYLELVDRSDPSLSRVVILDVSDPATPTAVGGFELGFAIRFAVSNHSVYAAQLRGGIRVIDVSDPAEPAELAWIPAEVYGLLAHGELLVVAEDRALVLFDVSDPRAPLQLDSAEGLFIDSGLAASGDTLFTHGPLGVGIDAWSLGGGSLELGGSYGADGPARLGSFDVRDGRLAVATMEGFLPGGTDRVEIVDVSNPAFPKPRFVADPVVFPFTRDVVVAEQRAYARDPDLGVLIYDVAGLRPVLRGLIEAPDVRGVAVRGDLAYVSLSPSPGLPLPGPMGLRIFDVSDPAAPRPVGALDVDGSAGDLVLGRARVYLVVGGGLQVVDVSDPRSPAPLGSVDVPAQALAAAGDHVFAVSRLGVTAVDVSDPAAPVVVDELDVDVTDVAYAGGLLIGASPLNAVVTIDASNPERLVELSRGSLCCVRRIAAHGPLAVAGSEVVRAVDVSDPAAPRHLGGSRVANDATLYDGRVYAAGAGGVFALDFGPEYLLRADVELARAGRWLDVALRGGPEFDVRRVDPESLALGPWSAAPLRPGRRRVIKPRDVDQDGHPDLVVRFDLAETGLSPGDREACLTGRVVRGGLGEVFFNGCDGLTPRRGRRLR